jgi:hypothetical protein
LFVRRGGVDRRIYPHERQTISENFVRAVTLVEDTINDCKVPMQIVSNNSAQK